MKTLPENPCLDFTTRRKMVLFLCNQVVSLSLYLCIMYVLYAHIATKNAQIS